jgi:chemotaxis protein MotB
MARRRKPAAHPNHERWLVSYADFITLLFALFVVMFASAQTDRSKAERVSESVRKALEEGQVKAAVAAILGGTRDDKGQGNAMMLGPGGVQHAAGHGADTVGEPDVPPDVSPDLAASLTSLQSALREEIEKGQLQISLQPRGLVISLREAAYFASGGDTVSPATFSSIEKIARAIKVLPNQVRLEGHTDSVPIHTARFRSNWDLSAARSIAMLELLGSRFGIPSGRMAVAGYAETVPLESNDSEQGRAHNRRVDVVILNENGSRPEPRPALAAR